MVYRVEGVQPLEQDTGPVIVGESKAKWNLFDLNNYGASLEFLGSARQDSTTQNGQPTLVDTENIARGTLSLFGQAFIGHKNFIDLNVNVRLQLENRWTTSESLNSDETSQDIEVLYDINAHILGASWFPMDAYARHDQQTLNRDFGTSFKQTTTEFGLIATLQSVTMPTVLQVSHSESDQRDSLGQFGYLFKKDTFSAQTNFTLSDSHRLEARYIFDSISEDQQGLYATNYLRHELTLTDSLLFGERKDLDLRSYFKYYEQGGLFDQKTLRLDEHLRWKHTDTLESRYNAAIEKRTRGTSEQLTYRGSAAIQHRLFESLVSGANVGWQRFTSGDFVSDDRFAGANLDYTKKIEPGRLDAALGLNFNSQVNGEQGTTLNVFDDSFVNTGGLFITISRRNIAAGSVSVTGPGGFPTYLEGVDYTVRYFPDRVEIVPIPGQGIGVGNTILVDYNIGPEPASTINTLTTSGSLRYTLTETWLQGLAGYVSCRMTKHQLSAVDPSLFTLDDVTETLVGAEYRQSGLTLRAEQEFHQSNVNAYDTTRLQALYDTRLGINSVLSLEVTNEMTKYKNPANEINFTRAGARWIQQLSQTLDLESRLIYRNERNTLAGNSEGVDARIGLKWHLRQTSAYVSFGHSLFTGPASKTQSNLLEFGFRREF